MGMIAIVTPERKVRRTVLRRKTADLEIVEQCRVDVREYQFAKHTCQNIKFKPLPFLEAIDHGLMYCERCLYASDSLHRAGME